MNGDLIGASNIFKEACEDLDRTRASGRESRDLPIETRHVQTMETNVTNDFTFTDA